MQRRWWQLSILDPYDTFHAKRQGRIDGELALPPWTSPHQPEFLRQLHQVANATLEHLARKWHVLDDQLKRSWAQASLALQHKQQQFDEAVRHEEHAAQDYIEKHGKPLTDSGARFAHHMYWLFVVVILICEFPLNAVVFQQLGVSQIETWFMTALIAAVLVSCAHHLGVQLHEPVRVRPVVLFWRILLALLPFAVIVFVALLRRTHMIQQALSQMSPTELLGVNLSINLLIFWALTYYSFKMHEPRTVAMLKAVPSRRSKRVEVDRAEQDLLRSRIRREKQFEQVGSTANALVAEARRRSAVYRTTHIRVRPDRDQQAEPVPVCFTNEPAISIPATLQALNWDTTAAPLVAVANRAASLTIVKNRKTEEVTHADGDHIDHAAGGGTQ